MNTVTTTDKPSSPMVIVRNELERMKPEFKAALPKHIPVERFKRVVMTAIANSPDLLDVDRRSLWNATMRAAQDGLLPDGREGAMVKMGNHATWLVMPYGVRKKARNSGELMAWDTAVVHENDEFDFALGDDPYIKHKPNLFNPGKVIAAYSIAVLKSGERSREVMSIAQIEAVRKHSRATSKDGPWFQHYEEMCRKTVLHRHAKSLPMSADLDDLIRRDAEIMDVREEVKESQDAERKSGASALDVFAAGPVEEVPHDAETGEIKIGPPEAMELGRQARRENKPMRSPPGEPDLSEAWLAGWRDEDEEISKAGKGVK